MKRSNRNISLSISTAKNNAYPQLKYAIFYYLPTLFGLTYLTLALALNV